MVTPNPGSPEAAEQGCKCPRMDNANGRGAWGTRGEDAIFWTAESCPLHGKAAADELVRESERMGLYDE